MKRITMLTMLLALLGGGVAHAQNGATPATPATTADAADTDTADTQYRLGPEDVISVFVWKEPDLSTSVMVRPDGKISLPLVEEFEAAGKTAAEIRELVTTALGRYIDNPVVSVSVEEINHPKISVLGEVRLPGRYLMRQKTTILDAIALAGGFTEWADRGSVTIVRSVADGVERIRVDLDGVLKGKAGNVRELQAGDTVYVQ